MSIVATVNQNIGLPGYHPGISKEIAEVDDANLKRLAEGNPTINAFLKLAVLTSPSIVLGHPMQAEMEKALDEVRNLYANMFIDIGVPTENVEVDKTGSLIIRVPGTQGYEDKQPIMLIWDMSM